MTEITLHHWLGEMVRRSTVAAQAAKLPGSNALDCILHGDSKSDIVEYVQKYCPVSILFVAKTRRLQFTFKKNLLFRERTELAEEFLEAIRAKASTPQLVLWLYELRRNNAKLMSRRSFTSEIINKENITLLVMKHLTLPQ